MGKFLRRDKVDHEDDTQQHLQMTIDTVSELKSELIRQKTTVFKLSNFEQRKIFNSSANSPPFYASPGGYQMCIRVYANGCDDAKDTHVSVYAFLMLGENDHHLSWPFTGTVTIELLNQLEDNNHFSHNVRLPSDCANRVTDGEVARMGYGSSRYIPHSSLGYDATRNCQYLKDDCLCFRVKAEAASPKPWLKTTANFW